MNDLEKYRQEIDEIDKQIIQLLQQRLGVVEQVKIYKQQHKIAILDSKREEAIYEKIEQLSDKEYASVIKAIYYDLMKHTKDMQREG